MPKARRAHQPRVPSKIMNEPVRQRKTPAMRVAGEFVSTPTRIRATPHKSTMTPVTKRAFRPRWSMLQVSFTIFAVTNFLSTVQ